MPRDVWFVIPPDLVLLDFAGAAEAFRLAAQGGAPLRLRYAATAVGVANTSLGIGLTGFAARGGKEIAEWLRRVVAPSDCTLACICAGALLAGRAGLLAGRRCTTHHSLVNILREVAPDADVLDSRVFVEDGGLFTSAGITAGIDLALHLIATLASPRLSAEVARELVVYLRRAPDDPALSPWIEGRNHMDARVHAVQDHLIREPERDWSLDELARVGHMSVRTLTRRFREMAGASVHDYHARLRVALARQALAAGASVEAAAMQAGLGSARQLRRLWSAHEGGTPGASRVASTNR
ncbi:MAG TPA: helix-turn-helix domain-containing protein [Tahibacter sp.]|nr:helix-turn-helix domain-containing protein [Tahibacter sp.]